jgi:hypothetical protein
MSQKESSNEESIAPPVSQTYRSYNRIGADSALDATLG